jgi:hypothetical protein
LNLYGEQHDETLRAANNCANSFTKLKRFEDAKSLLRSTVPVARRVLGESADLTLRMRWNYAQTLYKDPATSLGDLREAVETSEDAGRIARRVFGGTNPVTMGIQSVSRYARATLRAREAGKSVVFVESN